MADDNAPSLPGPDRETLRTLRHMLPAMAVAKMEGKLSGKGRPAMRTRPRKICKVCCTTFDLVTKPESEETPLDPALCENCDKKLKDGMIALVSADEFAFLKLGPTNTEDADLEGQIIHIHPERWMLIREQFDVQNKSKDNGKRS